jgi:hypothetical protein
MELALTRLRAIATHTNHRLVFSEAPPAYRIQRSNGTTFVDLSDPIELPADVAVSKCTAPGCAVMFRPRGNAGSFGTISLQTSQGDVRLVIVDIAGRVRIQ